MKRGFIVALLCAGLAFAATSDKKVDTQTRTIFDMNTFIFNPNTDELYQNGQIIARENVDSADNVVVFDLRSVPPAR